MTDQHDVEARRRITAAGSPASRQVNWFEVYSFATRFAANHDLELLGDLGVLVPGTPQWCGMPDDDARKLMALVLGGVREALTNDTHQMVMAEASQAISAAANWTAIANSLRRHQDAVRSGTYIPRKRSA